MTISRRALLKSTLAGIAGLLLVRRRANTVSEARLPAGEHYDHGHIDALAHFDELQRLAAASGRQWARHIDTKTIDAMRLRVFNLS